MAGSVDHGVGATRVGAHGAELVGVAHDPVMTTGDHGDGATEGEVRAFVGQCVAGAGEQLVLVMLVAGETGVQRFEHRCDDRGRAVTEREVEVGAQLGWDGGEPVRCRCRRLILRKVAFCWPHPDAGADKQ